MNVAAYRDAAKPLMEGRSAEVIHYFNVNPLNIKINTLRTGDADLRFYITAVQDG